MVQGLSPRAFKHLQNWNMKKTLYGDEVNMVRKWGRESKRKDKIWELVC